MKPARGSTDRGSGSSDELARYHRQVLLREVGEAGQRRLLASHALVVGCGALGTVSAEMLVRAGVGGVTIVDRDVVELTNLQRQVLFDESDVAEGLPKAEAARRKLGAINSGIHVRALVEDFNWKNAERIVLGEGAARVEVIVDGTDNFETRYLLNDAAVKHAIPYVYGAAVATGGMMMAVLPPGGGTGAGPCLRCIFEDAPAPGSAGASGTCDTIGVLGPVAAVIANMQCVEAMKIMLGRPDAVGRALVSIDLWDNEVRRLDVSGARRADCPCCGRREFPFLDGRTGTGAVAMCGRSSVQVSPGAGEGPGAAGGERVSLAALAERLRPHGVFTANRFLVRGVLERERGESGAPIELTVFADGRAIIGGTVRAETARAVYARYVGA